MRQSWILIFTLLAGCSETASSNNQSHSPSSIDTQNSDDSSSPAITVAFNELHAIGNDWLELVNYGDAPVDLANYSIADSAGDGTPRLDYAVQIPEEFTLAPHAFLLVILDDANADPGMNDDCIPDVDSCLHGTWGISASKGEHVFLLDASGTPVTDAHYPVGGSSNDHSVGRMPEGTGDFVETKPTPGANNEALE